MKDKMYELKTIIPNFDIKLPTCMYPVKPFMSSSLSNGSLVRSSSSSRSSTSNQSQSLTCCKSNNNLEQQQQLQSPKDVSESSSFFRDLRQKIEIALKNSPEMSDLDIRQQRIFQQLQDLKNQLLNMKQQYSLSSKVIIQEKQYQQTAAHENKKNDQLFDIVINANPKNIPYGLLALQSVWKDRFNLDITTYTHSTISKITKSAEDFQNVIIQESNKNMENIPSLGITLIWKNCEHIEMVSSPAAYVPIYGEVNILRYLARVGPNEYRYEEHRGCNEIDTILDICYQIHSCSTAKSRSEFIRTLNNRLQQRSYFGGDKLTIADIAVYGTIQRLSTQKDITGNLKDWLKRFEGILKS